jgi:predicted AlkP superfamily phosphohydrolase/phosphomutase
MWRSLADAGVMPYSKALLETGCLVPMQSSYPEVSSAAWASIVTGHNPGTHNVYGFTDLIDGSYALGFTSSRTFKSKPFWQRDDSGRALVMNVPQTYPAQPLNGVLISGFVALDLAKAVYPGDLLPLVKQIDYQVDVDMSAIEVSKERFLAELHRVLETRLEAFEHLWRDEAWDQVMFVITGTDRLNHYLWEDFEEPGSRYHQAFLDFYRRVDAAIQRLLERLNDDTTIAVVSDHGFGRQRISVNVNKVLQDAGLLNLSDLERPSYAGMTSETKAFALDPGRIYLHRRGRYPNGGLDDEQAWETEEDIIKLFQQLTIDGAPVVDRIVRGRDVYHGPVAHRAPDLVLMGSKDVALSGRLNTTELVESTPINGKHTFEDASFFIRGPGATKPPQPMRVEDVLHVVRQASAVEMAI